MSRVTVQDDSSTSGLIAWGSEGLFVMFDFMSPMLTIGTPDLLTVDGAKILRDSLSAAIGYAEGVREITQH